MRIAVVGAGPAGAGVAVRLARSGFNVCLVEREKFPRQKLCGEFISPECLEHFKVLEILDDMLSVGGDRITETVFYEPGGRQVSVPSSWFGDRQGALSMSRAEMDFRLLEKARGTGVEVLEETQVTGLLLETDRVCGVKAKSKDGSPREIEADLTIDATGRAGVLAMLARKSAGSVPFLKTRSRLVGFKTHLENVNMARGRCEIYFFRGGYGGLSHIENGLANHCFLIKSELVKDYTGRTDALVEDVIFANKRARQTLEDARPVADWLAVSVDSFGVRDLNPAPNLLTVGDAAAFIDPFTGSGMLMALESGELLAASAADNYFSPARIPQVYERAYRARFQKRLRVCSWLRRAAFVPNLAGAVISALSWSRPAQRFLAKATRQTGD